MFAHIDDVVDPHQRGLEKSRKLLRRLLAAGLSRYEPDPLRALAVKETK